MGRFFVFACVAVMYTTIIIVIGNLLRDTPPKYGPLAALTIVILGGGMIFGGAISSDNRGHFHQNVFNACCAFLLLVIVHVWGFALFSAYQTDQVPDIIDQFVTFLQSHRG